jgi:hypothetical protein
MKIKIYDPQPSDPDNPAVVVETEEGRFFVDEKSGGWAGRTVYRGAVRRDPVASALRGMAWCLGVPGGQDAEVPAQ